MGWIRLFYYIYKDVTSF